MTKDTDPDLRFMALNDLEKEMVNPTVLVSQNQLITYSQILVKCLDDEFSEVRTQSLKCFESIPFRLRQDIIPLIKELICKKPKKISITSTIYTMALHNILKNLPHIEQLYQNVIQIILPEILNDKKKFFTEIDFIEILNDLISYIGNFMTVSQISNTLNWLIDSSFNADTIIAKKSILSCSLLIRNVDDNSTITLFLNNLLKMYNTTTKKTIDNKIVLLSIFSAAIGGNPNLLYFHINQIWEFIIQCLNLNLIDKIDDDYESQQKSNLLRLDSINVLIKLFSCCRGENVEILVVDTLNICQSFLSYDPYHNNDDYLEGNNDDNDDESLNDNDDDDDDDDDDYDDDAYSDYEQDDDDGDDDDYSWKLRAESISLITVIIQNFPIKLPLIIKYNFNLLMERMSTENNKDVIVKLVESLTFIFEYSSHDGIYYNLLSSKAMAETTAGRRYSDVSMQTDDDPYIILIGQNHQICDCMLKFIGKFHSLASEKIGLLLKLLAKVINCLNGLESNYLQSYIFSLNEYWKGQLTTPDAFIFFQSLLNHESIESFGDGFPYLIEYLTYCLSSDSNHRLITDGLNLLDEIFAKQLGTANDEIVSQFSNTFVQLLCDKITNKNISTEIRLQSLNAIVSLICTVKIDITKTQNILFILSETISTEVLAYNSLIAIAKIINSNKVLDAMTSAWVKSILNYVLQYLNLSELNLLSLKVIKEFAISNLLDNEDGINILKSLDKIHCEKMFSSSNCFDIGIIMTEILKSVNFTNDLSQIISIVVDLSAYDRFDDILPGLMEQLLKQSSDEKLSQLIQQCGKTTDLKISKVLAVLSVVSGNEHSIGSIFENLSANKDVYFSLIFLNQVSKSIDLGVGLRPFLLLFSSDKPNVVNMSIRTVSTIVSKYTEKHLHEFLDYLKQTTYLEPSFKCLSLILNNIEIDIENASDIFTLIIEIQRNLTINVDDNKSFESAASCLGNIVIKYDLLESMLTILSDSTSYMKNLAITIGNTPKYTFMNDNFLKTTSLQLLVKYSELTTNNFIFNPSLLFKEAGISNLNLILNKKPNIAISLMTKLIPNIIESEIKPNKDYIHTQFIGPYKHKIDDGLNYRKQVVDSIYYLFKTLEDNKNLVFLCNIRWALYFNKFFDAGIKDDQSIASVVLLTTLKLFERDPTIFGQDIGNVDIFEGFISRCRKTINKKIADNAVKQDIEKQNNLIKMVIRFLKKSNLLVENNRLILTGNQTASWTAFIHETKSKFPIFNTED
ncbi:hypothetical protein C6P42_004499 [Pichia californica]|nr:hypothetical protein C6P42_004499 [[Candida] californica]